MSQTKVSLSDLVCRLEVRIELLDAKIANSGYTKQQKLADIQKLREYGQQLREYVESQNVN